MVEPTLKFPLGCCVCFAGEMTNTNVELVRVTDEGKVVKFSASEVQDYLDEAE